MATVDTLTDDATGITANVETDEYPENPRDMGDCFAASLTQLSRDYRQPDNTSDERITAAWNRGYSWRADGMRGSGRGYSPDVELVERYACAYLGAVAVDWLDDPRSSSRIFGYVSAERAAELGISDAAAALRAELAEYGAWCSGDVYVITIADDTGEMIDSCGGFYGYEYAEQSAREMLADHVARVHAERIAMYRALVNAS